MQLYAGPLNAVGEFEDARPLTMEHVPRDGPGRHLFVGKIDCGISRGRHGFAVRIVPSGLGPGDIV